ncbi:hypothetical protein [Clostridium sp.]|uniref:hypothetical protein n=1 Tax=Clostridium sp. TaxID=1506 RepID=UPI002603E405|nr:hypothetical protein [Clostridium sp.]
MQGYGNANKIVKQLSEKAKYILQKYYTSSFSKNSDEFQYLMRELRQIWGLNIYDYSEDMFILSYLDNKREIELMEKDYYKYRLLNVIAMEAEYIPNDNFKEHLKKQQSYEMGSKMYEYILDHSKDKIIFKIIKSRHEDVSIYNKRIERVDCYVFKQLI